MEDKTTSYLMHCMDFLREKPDKFYDLAIVDPPYGIDAGRKKAYKKRPNTVYIPKDWDSAVPGKEYFDELFRVSKNQIIWGGNYFDLPACKKPIIWDKIQPEGLNQAMFEYAWQSNDSIQAKIFHRSINSDNNKVSNGDKRAKSAKKRIHPTQKPVKLYEWLLKNYAKPGDRILDTHGGSQSSRIACFNMGFELDLMEIDEDYFKQGNARFERHKTQLQIFT